MPTKNDMLPAEVYDPETGEVQSFEEKMLDRVRTDYGMASEFMTPFHRLCVDRHEMYHNASQYETLKKVNRFPMPFFQEQVDVFVADVMDKMFYKNRPCTLSGVEEADKEDADVKQKLFDWQDYKDKIKSKIKKFVKDTALYGVSVAQIDYVEEREKKIVAIDVPVPLTNPDGSVVIDDQGQPIMKTTPDGRPVTVRKTEVRELPKYIGPTVKRVDPTNLFVIEDNDETIMIRSQQRLKYFKTRKYFFNYQRLKDDYQLSRSGTSNVRSSGMTDSYADDKRKHRSFGNRGGNKGQKECEYIEWQGKVNRRELYEYLDKPVDDENGDELISRDDEVFAICGVVNDAVVVRLEETPFDFDKSNVIIGSIQPEEDDIIGVSLADKIGPTVKALDVLMGIRLANFKQSVNAGHVLNKSLLVHGSDTIVNKEGFVLEVNGDVRAAHKRIEQPRLSPDLIQSTEEFKQMGRTASGVSFQASGVADPGIDTLGEANIIDSNTSLRIKDYLASFEESFIEPMYELRNQINMQFLTGPYVYGIVGDSAVDWRQASTTQIRANVDFICESSVRETNKGIITQQLLQFTQLSPLAQQMGFPVRLDKMMGKLAEQGFSWSVDQVEDILPTLKLEKQGIDIDDMLLQAFIVRLQMMGAVPGAGLGGEGGLPQGSAQPNQELPQPRTEQEANLSNQSRNQTQVGRVA